MVILEMPAVEVEQLIVCHASVVKKKCPEKMYNISMLQLLQI